MKITYDAIADAVYVYLSDKVNKPETRRVDDDIYMDFNEDNRLVGIEVLAASERLQMSMLMPFVDRIDVGWLRLRSELRKLKQAGLPVETTVQRSKNWVEEVGDNYVILRRDKTGSKCRISRPEFEDGTEEELRQSRKWAVTHALRDIAFPVDSSSTLTA